MQRDDGGIAIKIITFTYFTLLHSIVGNSSWHPNDDDDDDFTVAHYFGWLPMQTRHPRKPVRLFANELKH